MDKEIRLISNVYENLSQGSLSSDENDGNDPDAPEAPTTMLDMFSDDDFASVLDNESLMEEFIQEAEDPSNIDPENMFLLDPAQINDALGPQRTEQDVAKPYRRLEFPSYDISPFPVTRHRDNLLCKTIEHPVLLTINQGVVSIRNAVDVNQVGICHDFNLNYSLYIDDQDYINLATTLSEEASTKATCLGYSSFLHSIACIIITGQFGILEPIEGFDVIREGISFEVTGVNYKDRASSANCVINKYLLVSSLCKRDSYLDDIIEFSYKEDCCDTSIFDNGGLDQDRSPYSDIADGMHKLTSTYPVQFFEGLSRQFLHWYSVQEPVQSVKFEFIDHSNYISDVILKYSKQWEGKSCVPAPFRILGGKRIEKELAISLVLEPYQSGVSIGTTFHTFDCSDDPEVVMLRETPHEMKALDYSNDTLQKYVSDQMMKYDIYRTTVIESELMSKINGRKGCFYSDYSNAGICWRRVRSGSLTFFCAYYQIGEPPSSCGKWLLQNPDKDVWLSPTFKVSLSDINFAKILPARFNTMIISAFAYTNKKNRIFVLQKMCLMLGFTKWSTWQTSAIFGDMRFLTLCAVSASGDISAMVKKAADKVTKFISFPDYYCLFLLRRFSSKYENKPLSFTPIYNMPIRFLGIEKDFALFTMWHIRGESHATACFLKLRDGIILEEQSRNEVLAHLYLQLDAISTAPKHGLTQSEFNSLMITKPHVPYFNYLVFAALARISAKTLSAGMRQSPTKNKLVNLVSDHHSTVCSNPSNPADGIITATRVANGFSDLLRTYENPTGIHSLLQRMHKGSKLKSVFLIHPKDSKSKNREIPQMTNYMRVPQFVSETLLSVYTDDEDADMMQNPEKFSIYANRFSKIMKKRGETRSEDKSFFCGHMHPEFMSVAIGILAKVLGSTSVVLASALLRCDKSRVTVTPIDMDESVISNIQSAGEFSIKQGKKLIKRKGILNYVHMQQGVRAMAAACINTVFATGIDLIQRDVAPDILDSVVITTSDDSARGVCLVKKPTCNGEDVINDYIEAPISLMPHVMMIDSIDKPIRSSLLSEFNNVICGPNGLYPQHFAHSHLLIQPLLGENIVDDIFELVSRCRSCLSWGDSFDTCRAAFGSYLILLMQKWLITEAQLNILMDAGFFPRDDNQLLRGGGELTLNTKLCLLRNLTEETKNDVVTNNTKLHAGLRKFNVKPPKTDRKHFKAINPVKSLSMQRAYDKINAARRLKGNIKPDFLRPYNFRNMSSTKEHFFAEITKLQPPATDEELEIISKLPKLPDVVIIPREPRARSFLPCVQGGKVKSAEDLDVRLIIAKRLCNLNVSRYLTIAEKQKCDMSDIDFKTWLNKRDITQFDYGLRFKSPTGRPLMRFHDEIMFSRPQLFTFEILLPNPVNTNRNWTFGGISYPTFIPCWWGGGTIDMVIKGKMIMAMGFAIEGSKVNIFFQPKNHAMRCHVINDFKPDSKFINFVYKQHKIYCPIARDYSPVNSELIKESTEYITMPGLIGNATTRMNYGNYMNTNMRTSCTWMRRIYNKANSDYPNNLNEYKPNYPFFKPNSTKFPMAREVITLGHKYVTHLELTFTKDPRMTITINLNDSPPTEVEVAINEIEVDWD